MGIDYSASLAVGFYFEPDEVLDAFTEEVEEVSHLEKRWDPKTGKEDRPEKVIDQEGGKRLVFKGEVVGDGDEDSLLVPQDLFGALAGHLKCQYWDDGWPDELKGVVFGFVPKRNIETGWSTGNADTTAGIRLDDVAEMEDRLGLLEMKLRALGLKPGPAGVFPILSIS